MRAGAGAGEAYSPEFGVNMHVIIRLVYICILDNLNLRYNIYTVNIIYILS